jgi:hypothetical protein
MAEHTPDDPRLVFMPFADIEKRSGPSHVIRDSWWATHPERGLVFYAQGRKTLDNASPQCNRDKRITEMLAGKLYPWAEIKFMPVVICPAKD